jgi:hypothetical protein
MQAAELDKFTIFAFKYSCLLRMISLGGFDFALLARVLWTTDVYPDVHEKPP